MLPQQPHRGGSRLPPPTRQAVVRARSRTSNRVSSGPCRLLLLASALATRASVGMVRALLVVAYPTRPMLVGAVVALRGCVVPAAASELQVVQAHGGLHESAMADESDMADS